MKQNLPLVLLIALLLPLFYVNVKDSHDWGDDFAQYFIQARNILDHRPQTDNGLVFDSQTGEYALKAYPVGFPLILATAWWFFGNSILVSSFTLSFFYFAFGLVAFFYFKKYFNEAISLLLVLVVIYNPSVIGLKREILSDVPFSFFLLLGILLFQSERKNILHFIFTGIVWGFALSVRGIGATLFLASGLWLLQMLFQLVRKKNRIDFFISLKKFFIVILSAFSFYLLLNAVLFPIPSTGILKFYGDAISGENFRKWILLNLSYYYEVFLNIFATMGGSYRWISTLTKFILLALIPIGLLISWIRRMHFDDWLFIAYLAVLFIYPYLGGGFRFLLPVMPIVLKYICIAFTSVMKRVRIKSSAPVLAFLLLVIIQYTPGIIDQVKSMDFIEEGPQEEPTIETFEFISKLPEGSTVVFLKPRALSFYSGRQAAYFTRNIIKDELPALFNRMNAHYFLLCNENEEVFDPVLINYIEEHKHELNEVWKNKYFTLYTDLK